MVFSMTLVVLFVLFGITAVALLDVESEARRLTTSTRAIAQRTGIVVLEGPCMFQGELDGFWIEIGVGNASRSRCTEIRVSGRQPPGLEISARRGDLAGPSSGRITGDPHFDAIVEIGRLGTDRLLGWLDEPTRAVLAVAVLRGATLRAGVWSLTADGIVTDEATLEPLLGTVLGAARVTSRTTTIPDVARLVTEDPVLGVRRNALEALLRWGAADEGWLREIARRDDPPIAVRAAAAAGDRARLLYLLRYRSVARDAALTLAEWCDDRHPLPPSVEDVLIAGVEAGDVDLVDALGRVGTVRALPALRELAARWLGFAGRARRAREAARAIDQRATRYRGGLTFAAHDSGHLSPVDPARTDPERSDTAAPPPLMSVRTGCRTPPAGGSHRRSGCRRSPPHRTSPPRARG